MKIEGVIFDLDDTLFDCTGQLTDPARQRAARIFASANPSLNTHHLCHAQETLSETLGSSEALRQLGRKHSLPEMVVQQALLAYNSSIVEKIEPFSDAIHVLTTLRERGYALSLVTSGSPERQRQKVQQLGLSVFFGEAEGTLFLHDDRPSPDKRPFLIRAARQMGLPHAAILAIGDKLTAEISAANALGMQTARLRHGRQKSRTPQTGHEQPDFDIQTLSQLLAILL